MLLQGRDARAGRRTRVRRAIERGEIANLYQPIVDLTSGEVTAVEVSPRWYDNGRMVSLAKVRADGDRALSPQIAAATLELLENDLALLWDGRGRIPACVLPISKAQLKSHEVMDRLCHIARLVSAGSSIVRLQLDGDPRRALGWPLRSKLLDSFNSGVSTVQDAAEAAGSLLTPGTMPLCHVRVPLEAMRNRRPGADMVLRTLIETAHQQRMDVSALGITSAEDVGTALSFGVHRGQGGYVGDCMPIEAVLERIRRHRLKPDQELVG